MKKQKSNPFWGIGESKNFGKVAISYAAGEDVVLDQQLVQYECLVNKAHVVMLFKQGLITKKVAGKLLQGLDEIAALDKEGKFKLQLELEDVHSNVEQYLIKKYGIEVGGYLRLGIARNDQIYTDTRLWLKDKLLVLCQELLYLVKGLISVAQHHVKTVMPGYTHLRISQPITYGHWLVAKAYHFIDDLNDLLNIYEFANQCPLGIFEMAGTHLPIDRKLTAQLLGFKKSTANSLYTANQRGELEVKLLSVFSLLALHIRRTMTEVIIFSTHEFQLLKIDDLYTTGGTAQPNLKNPDTLEVVRANMAKMSVGLIETLMIMDPLPSGFNRDTQQTKPILFSTVDMMIKTLPVVVGILTSLTPNKEKMLKTAQLNFSVAPDVAIQLCVKGGVSFRQAYAMVKALIKDGYLKKSFSELTPDLVAKLISQKEIDQVSTAKACVFSHTSLGGPAPVEVKKQIKQIDLQVNNWQEKIKKQQQVKVKALDVLEKSIGAINPKMG